jgi:hypothetical protein
VGVEVKGKRRKYKRRLNIDGNFLDLFEELVIDKSLSILRRKNLV